MNRGLPEHRRVARAVRGVLGKPLLMTTVIQVEVAHVLVRQMGLAQGIDRMTALMAHPFEVDPLDEDVVAGAMEQLRLHAHLGVGGRDATLLASMARRGSTELWTHDAALKRVPGLKVVDPAERGAKA
jgi:predicted nucleic acid-binding protein